MQTKITQEVLDYIKSLDLENMRFREVYDAVEDKFHLDLGQTTLKKSLNRHNIIYKNNVRWTEEYDKFLIEKNDDTTLTVKDITNQLNKRFDTHYSIESVKTRMFEKLKLTRPINLGSFKKGRIPINKGVKGVIHLNHSGCFAKGNRPQNTLPVGTETRRRSGNNDFIYVKIAEPNVWISKQKYMYEKYHNVKLNDKDRVIFLNNNSRDFSEENLELVSQGDIAISNSMNYNSSNIEIRKAQLANVRLIRVISKKRKELKGEK